MPRTDKPRGLGRGLSALLPEADATHDTDLRLIPVGEIHPNPEQPRRALDPVELEELAASIRASGILQPLVVTRYGGNGFQLVAGERRWRAAQIAGLGDVPCRVIEVDSDETLLALSLIENLQREDLGPLETAAGYKRLHDQFGLTQEQIATRVGRNRATVANSIRLLELTEPIQASLADGRISVGHAKVLLGLEGNARRSALWKKILDGALSVRQTEAEAKSQLDRPGLPPKRLRKVTLPPYHQEAVEQLRQALGTRVEISRRGEKGSIRIEYYSDDDLERLVELILPPESR
ncbi:MAG: ParB/RepB/Spo0J family partition protein [Calditrichaeota bacterium]|nr:ParB/RepB/Spo0J family partition protein [Calditrichota bacterium]